MRGIYQLAIILSVPLLALAGRGSAHPYDDLYQAQQSSEAQSGENAFASGYFPAAFAEPQLDCGYPAGPIEIIDEVEREWYPRQWRAAREPSYYRLSTQDVSPKFALRFSYIPSFNPSVFIRVEKVGDDYRLIVKEMSGAGGYDPRTISRSKEVLLSVQQVSEMERLLTKEKLFEQTAKLCGLGFDGSQWIFEKVDASGYKMVNRRSPDRGAAYNLGKYLMGLTKWRFDAY